MNCFHSFSSIVGVIFALFVLGFIQAGADGSVSSRAATCPRIVSRLGWGAEEPESKLAFSNLPEFVVICHTVTSECHDLADCSSKVRAIQAYHKNEKHWDDIGYNFIIGGDGAVYEGRGWDYVGAHSTNYNAKSIGISFIGTFVDRLPNQAAIDAAKKLIKCGVEKGKILQEYKLVGHRQVIATNSPGDKLYDEIKTWDKWNPHQEQKKN